MGYSRRKGGLNVAQKDFLLAGRELGVTGWNLDLEPTTSVAADGPLYAAFLRLARPALNAAGMRLTIAVSALQCHPARALAACHPASRATPRPWGRSARHVGASLSTTWGPR